MRRFFTFVLAISAFQFSYGQICQPDPRYPDTLVGVFPLPLDPATNPGGGIRDTACINKDYEFVFTAVVGETFTFNGIAIPLDSIVIPTVNGIRNLPTGMTYGCNPGNCTFKKKTKGCAVISGKVTDPNLVGDYLLTIAATVFLNGSRTGLPITFPSPGVFPGTYTLSVREENFRNCSVASTDDLLSELLDLKVVPNPFNSQTAIQIYSPIAGDFTFSVTDVVGRVLEVRDVSLSIGDNSIVFNGNNCPNGHYFFRLENERGAVSGKMVIAGK